MSKSEGQEIREAYDGPSVEHDALIGQIEARAREQFARSSDASESAAKVKEFVDETGLNTRAYTWLSAIIKTLPKKDGQAKAMDVIRSLEVGLPMIKAHVAGQGTVEMEFGQAEPEDEEMYPDPELDTVIADGDPELAAEAKEFEAAADDVVTPIDFGGRAG